MSELAKCPFCPDGLGAMCGSKSFFVECRYCLARTSTFWTTEEAADAWNRRAPAASAVPEGWKLVPVEPTEGMIKAVQGIASHPRARELIVADWRDMLAAAPVEGGGK